MARSGLWRPRDLLRGQVRGSPVQRLELGGEAGDLSLDGGRPALTALVILLEILLDFLYQAVAIVTAAQLKRGSVNIRDKGLM